jgi:hypothetical protein
MDTFSNLFGDDTPPPRGFLRDEPAPVELDLFTATAERNALASGRPLSQERVALLHPTITEENPHA